MKQNLSNKNLFALGFLMLALFLGAGNLIFPPQLGQEAGTSVLPAIFGFLLTGVGLPLLAIVAISQTNGDMFEIANRVHSKFAIAYSFAIYLALGPFFGIPRTSTVTYEIGVAPFLPDEMQGSLSLLIATFIFFVLTYFLSLNPSKLIDRIGKMLMPLLLILIGVLTFSSFVMFDFNQIHSPIEKYENGAIFSGFIEGYLTMDTIAALIFGIVIMDRLADLGIKDNKLVAKYTIQSGLIAGAGLSFVYISLALLGTISVSVVGSFDNGGRILSEMSFEMYQHFGTILLAAVIIVACLTTAIGLVSACSEFLAKRFPKISYSIFLFILTFASFLMANLGLSQLISISLPVLIFLYPITIALIVLAIVHSYVKVKQPVYICTIIATSIFSLIDGLVAAGLPMNSWLPFLDYIPLYNNGIGWFFPALIGLLIGITIAKLQNHSE
ncbi:branched-chain amino acid transporter [Alkalihalobacillus alcalophilus ATCC 27647 = CGMCC 1.3604]|uniref:Branched-chain amino acid transport system carrier protein n=1 Tax=Alkalihalobacillus alcalophilus ATCC 27647 = CGMCC 1.3604 TaxID=1218173 RepID=J8Q4I1_ALKAL|nr:branched-chain amino acid transport system II carrier protein [Alkalihalobacillus alcalophilus]AFV25971.1 branched-chain amino acid transporter [Alkalihalobacillus alcalophilus ATCC 27647 = CGMCC 1.3604]KGA96188.1 branched-chain amino acid transporter [Alkalihalobacillus alcalophilus ATCC 27647 = CGMCC 1.3604]MED1561502.1 branched-chain amino acid transport system II carrier protein [Alkalihalobacillus alcalophilus]THG91545.1 branched-chain amino acid transporter [Alkalihalobacillus alcaloph